MSRGRFITFEGGEGAGKSTQVRRLAERLGKFVTQVVVTREPGGSAGAEAIRELLVHGATDRWSPTTETLLMYAARRDHIEQTIAPALDAGGWVICDRYADSTRAYQGAAGGVDPAFIQALEQNVLGEVAPDLTLILDVPVAVGLGRAAARGEAVSRFEEKGADFHQRLRAAYLEIARQEPARCIVIDAVGELDTIEEAIWRAVSDRLGPF